MLSAISPLLNSQTAAPAVVKQPSVEQQTAIIRQLVLPFGDEGRREPAIHIHATADGYRRIYASVAGAMSPEGAITVAMADAIEQHMPTLSREEAVQSAKSYTINRRDEALGMVAALDGQGPLVQQAVNMSEALRLGQMQPQDLPHGVNTESGTLADKTQRLTQQASIPLPFTRENQALHGLAFSQGHVPMHAALADVFAPDGPVTQMLTQRIAVEHPDIPINVVKDAANSYSGYWHGLAQFDVEKLQPSGSLIRKVTAPAAKELPTMQVQPEPLQTTQALHLAPLHDALLER